MKTVPVVLKELLIENDEFIVDLVFDVNITILSGMAGTGKTVIFRMIKDRIDDLSNVTCFNYENYDQDILQIIKESRGKLIIVDNADILLNDLSRKYISLDSHNQYLLIGRNPKNLFAMRDNFYEIMSEKLINKTRLFNVLCF